MVLKAQKKTAKDTLKINLQQIDNRINTIKENRAVREDEIKLDNEIPND